MAWAILGVFAFLFVCWLLFEPKCPRCGSRRSSSAGFSSDRLLRQRRCYFCNKCGKYYEVRA